MAQTAGIPQHSLLKSIFYHLFPGLCVLLFYLGITPFFLNLGFSPGFGLLISFALIGIPVQVFIMAREGGKGSLMKGLKNVIFYTRRMPLWQYVVFTLIFLVYAVLAVSLLSPVNEFLLKYFTDLPDWFTADNAGYRSSMPALLLAISFAAQFLIDGLLNPVVEEFYFRGFLLPRISRFSYWSPMINAALFAIAHFWQPWNSLQIFILVLPVYFLVWKKKNLYIAMIVHCLANLIGFFLAVSGL